MIKHFTLLLAILSLPFKGLSCSCYPASDAKGFCDVLAASQSQPMFCVVKAEIVEYFNWGIKAKVLSNLHNTANNDTILIWGDPGACCRPTFATMSVLHDTLIMALQQTDFCGNFIMPSEPDYETANDYVLQGCGAYYMYCRKGKVIGDMNANTLTFADTLDEADFISQMQACLLMSGVNENLSGTGIGISPNPFSTFIGIDSEKIIGNITIYNSAGQCVYAISPGRNHFTMDLSLAPGMYFIHAEVEGSPGVLRRKIVRQ